MGLESFAGGITRLSENGEQVPGPRDRRTARGGGGSSNLVQSAFAGLAHVISVKTGQAASQTDVQPVPASENLPSADEENSRANLMAREQEYVVAVNEPPNKFSYYLDADCSTVITWRFQSIPRGTRVNYEEEFCDENTGGEDFLPTVQRVVHEWMQNIKRYNELRGSRGRRLVKWYLDRFFLKLRPDQRRTVLLILFVHGIAIFTFLVAAIGLGIAGLFF
jgi:hypothetical protein